MRRWASVLTAIPVCAGFAIGQELPVSTAGPPDATITPATSKSADSGRSFYGILVDSKCASLGMSSRTSTSTEMPRTTAQEMSQRTGIASNESLLNRSTPSSTGRTWNSTDNNTSGSADRIGTASSINRSSSTEPTSKSTVPDPLREVNRPPSSDMNHMPTTTARTSSDMPLATGNAGSGRGTDTQMASNPGPFNRTGESNPANLTGEFSNVNNWDKSCFISTTSNAYVLQLQDGRTLKIDDEGATRISSQLQSTGRVASKNKIFRVKVTGDINGDSIHITDIQM